jgi:hypothetical protein
MMHDELMVGRTWLNLRFWAKGDRKVDPGGELHPTVSDRL